jgi:hypothetical protein
MPIARGLYDRLPDEAHPKPVNLRGFDVIHDLTQRVPRTDEVPPGRYEPPPLLMLWLFADAMADWAYKDSPGTGDPSPCPGENQARGRM